MVGDLDLVPLDRAVQDVACDIGAPVLRTRDAWTVLPNRRYTGYLLTFALGFGVLMAYISASPFVVELVLGLSILDYSPRDRRQHPRARRLESLAGRLSTTIAPQRQLRATLLKLTVLTGALVVQTVFVLPSLVGSAAARWSTLLLIFAASTIGAVPGNAATMAMAPVPATAGTGSALMGGSTILTRGTCPRW